MYTPYQYYTVMVAEARCFVYTPYQYYTVMVAEARCLCTHRISIIQSWWLRPGVCVHNVSVLYSHSG